MRVVDHQGKVCVSEESGDLLSLTVLVDLSVFSLVPSVVNMVFGTFATIFLSSVYVRQESNADL